MTAEIRVADRPGIFIAESCHIDGAAVHAHGRWRYRVGANHAEYHYSRLRTYTWPLGRCREIRWTTEATS